MKKVFIKEAVWLLETFEPMTLRIKSKLSINLL